jgi:molybdopterin-guanine dinucleotide biosynthesis protein A
MPVNATVPQSDCCAVILAGGLNSRMGGHNKAFLKVGDKTILERLLETIAPLFDEILLVTRQPERYSDLPLRVVTDIYPARSSLTGIHAGLKQAVAQFAFVLPCDAPFIKPDLVRFILNELQPSLDVIVPVIGHHYEPLCAIYSKRCLPHIESQLDHDDFAIINFFDRINLKTIPAQRIQTADTDMISFFNVNTPEALQKSQDMAERK